MRSRSDFERRFSVAFDDLHKAFFNSLAKNCSLADFFAESSDVLHVEYNNGSCRTTRADVDKGFAFRQATGNEDPIFECHNNIGGIFPALKESVSAVTPPSDKEAKQLLGKLEKALFNKTVLAESLSMRWRCVNRRVAVLNEKGNFSCNASKITTWDALVTVRKSGKMYKGRVAKSWYGAQNPPRDLTRLLMRALNDAQMKAQAKPIKPGNYNIKFAAGEPAILFHELLGHALEADYVLQGSSPFCGMHGKIVTHPSVTLIDMPPPWHGKNDCDDEATEIRETTLIQEGRLLNFMSDRVSSGRLGIPPTGNGRRSNWSRAPMARMYHTAVDSSNFEIGEDTSRYLLVEQVKDAFIDVEKGLAFIEVPFARYIKNGMLQAFYGPLVLRWNIFDALRHARVCEPGYKEADAVSDCLKNREAVPVLIGQAPVLFLNMPIVSPSMS